MRRPKRDHILFLLSLWIVTVTLRAQTTIPGTLRGRGGLLAVPIMVQESMPKPILGVGVATDGTVYVTRSTRQMREEISLIQSPFLQEQCMALTSTAMKRRWILDHYSNRIAGRQGVRDFNRDGKVDAGDLIVHSEEIYTLHDSDGDGVFDRSKRFADGFQEVLTGVAHSVTPIGGHVYATIIPNLWKLTDTDSDGVADRKEILVHGFANHIGYGNHDLHSIVEGYDGKIYWSMGDRGVNVLTREGVRVSNPHSGCILRCNLDGSGFEVFASGLRNCQYFDFDEFGNIFSVDHDADFRGERERLVYLPQDSDSGWRMYYQYRHSTLVKAKREDLYNPWLAEKMWIPFHEGQPSHILPPIENSWNAPASFSLQPGTALGGQYAGCFLLGGSGNIRAFKMVADGATFRREGEDVVVGGLSSQVLTSTIAPDGRLLFTLWKPRGSALWALQPAKATAAMTEVKALIGKGLGGHSVRMLVTLLGHADRRIRQQAQFTLVARRQTRALVGACRDTSAALLSRVHGLWGLLQLEHRDPVLLAALCADADDEMRAQTARWAGELNFDPENRVVALLRDESPRVRLMASIACGKLKSRKALDGLVDLIVAADNEIPILRHGGVVGLVGVATRKQLAAFQGHSSTAMRIAAVLALRRLGAIEELRAFVSDSSGQVMSDAVTAIYDDATPKTFADHPDALATVAAALDPGHPAPVNVRAIAANRRVGSAAAARRIATFLASPKLNRILRIEALYALESWPDAATLDPMDGRHFPVTAGDPGALATAIGSEIWSLANDRDDKVSVRAISLMRRIQPSEAQLDRVTNLVLDEAQRIVTREAWLQWLAGKDLVRFASVGVALLSSESPVLRAVAAKALVTAKRGKAAVSTYLLATLKDSRDAGELQEAIRMVPTLPTSALIVAQLLEDLIAGRVVPQIQFEVLELATRAAKKDATLQKKLAGYTAHMAEQDVMTQFLVALHGGNANRGRRIFLTHALAQCSKCHALKQTDKQVGPSLQGIAKRHTREYLLQSIVAPQAEIALGYGIINASLHDGRTITGTLIAKTATRITIKTSDGSTTHVLTSQIRSQSIPVGTMPDLRTILTKQQIRDLVAYLATLK